MFTGSEHFKGGGDQRAFFEAMERIGATDLNGTTSERPHGLFRKRSHERAGCGPMD